MNRLEYIASKEAELLSLKTPRLTLANVEDVDDVYQDAIEIGYYKDELRSEIADLKVMSDADYELLVQFQALL